MMIAPRTFGPAGEARATVYHAAFSTQFTPPASVSRKASPQATGKCSSPRLR